MPELDAYAEQVIRETAYFIWKREGALRDTRRIIGNARLSKYSAMRYAAMTMSFCRMRERSCQATRREHACTFDQGRARRLNRGRVNIPPSLSARLHMEDLRKLFPCRRRGLDSGVFCLSIFLAAARWAHADPREPTDSLSQHKPIQWRRQMADSVYKVVEVVGTSNESISKAISRAISKAGATLRHLGWFEVVQIRGSIENDQIRQYQVTVKVGFTLEED